MASSCKYPYPEVKDKVRGEIFVAGYILEKKEENLTKITYISDMDLKGSIPGFIKKQIAKSEGAEAASIGPAMEKYSKK